MRLLGIFALFLLVQRTHPSQCEGGNSELRRKRCTPCESGGTPYSPEEVQRQLEEVREWLPNEDFTRISKQWRFRNFKEAIAFVNKVSDLAEEEGHHPDVHVTQYRYVMVELWTFKISGLSENDFIMASKIDGLSE